MESKKLAHWQLAAVLRTVKVSDGERAVSNDSGKPGLAGAAPSQETPFEGAHDPAPCSFALTIYSPMKFGVLTDWLGIYQQKGKKSVWKLIYRQLTIHKILTSKVTFDYGR